MRNLTSKYHSKKVIYSGHKFDSKKEMYYYIKLKQLQKEGKIKELELQKKYELQPSFKLNGKTRRAITYKADFVYKDNKIHVIDVKGFKTDVYQIKKKLFEYKYGIEIEEV